MSITRSPVIRNYLPWMLAALVAAPLAAGERVRTLEETYRLESGQSVRLDLPVAEVSIDGTGRKELLIEATIECDRSSNRCRELADEIRFERRSSEDYLSVTLEGYPENARRAPSIELRMSLPRSAGLELDLGVGEIEIYGLENDLTIDLGVGDVEVAMSKARVKSVEVEVGIGDAELHPRLDRVDRSGFLGSEISWRDGTGDSRIAIDVGVGDVEIELD